MLFSPTLTTERFILEPLGHKDAEALMAIFSDVETMLYWSTPPWTSIEEAHQYIEQQMESIRTQSTLALGIYEKESKRLIGKCELFNFHQVSRRAEIGYILNREYWGKGVMSEATYALISYGINHLNLRRIEADIDVRNHGSVRVLEKLGFVREGLLRDRWEVGGIISDSLLYGLLADEFPAKNQHL